MRITGALLTIALAVGTLNAALAYPEGAPWGAANPEADENCATCHFDYDPLCDSEALSIEGLPQAPLPRAIYDLTIRFSDPDAVVAGFQLIATTTTDHSAGVFYSPHGSFEFFGGAIRSTEPADSNGRFEWSLSWTAPDEPAALITFYLAVIGANDDGSPFGDRSHFRTFELTQ